MDKSVKDILDKIPYKIQIDDVTEIRLRSGCNIYVYKNNKLIELQDTYITNQQIENILLQFCQYTIPAYQKQISQGFITLSGGHRVGIGGQYTENLTLKKVTSLNIRLNTNHNFDIDKNLLSFRKGLLIAGSPHSGKTTFLRNIINKMSGNITVCDERNEIINYGLNCDFISGINKAAAISQATRSLNPDYIICDEIGDVNEARQILSSTNSGVKFICTAHCDSLDELYLKPNIKLLLDSGVFDRLILLSDKFHIKDVRDV